MEPIELQGWAREVAALISQGHAPNRIAEDRDLSALEIEQVLDSEEFLTALEAYGEEVVNAWLETRAATKNMSFRRRIADRMDTYYEELDKLATSAALKPEKRADILLALLKVGSGGDSAPVERVEMPPQLLENWARRTIEFNRHEAEFQYGTRKASDGDTRPAVDTASAGGTLRERGEA